MPKALITGLAGFEPNAAERALFETADPLGFILFARNCADPAQLAALTASLREIVGRADAPILIDQEGGRVQRLGPPHWRAAPAAAALARIDGGGSRAERAVRLNAQLIGAELASSGIDVDCAPVLDLPAAGSDDVIGDRAFSAEPGLAARLGRAFCDGLIAAGVLPVIKHIPGHGRARADSHRALPVIDAAPEVLAATDFAPFAALSHGPAPEPWAMTAHVVLSAFDPEAPVTQSARVIADVIRGAIGFDGVLLTDDLSMGALSGPVAGRAEAALAAGCDIVLHCNGDMAEMEALAAAVPELGAETQKRLQASLGAMPAPEPFDREAALSELADLLAPARSAAS